MIRGVKGTPTGQAALSVADRFFEIPGVIEHLVLPIADPDKHISNAANHLPVKIWSSQDKHH